MRIDEPRDPEAPQGTGADPAAAKPPTSRSLADQMALHELEIERRKELLGFTAEDARRLAAARAAVLADLDSVVDAFYERQTAIPEIATIIGDSESLLRLSRAMRTYVSDLFSGYYDETYINNRLRIGLVHKRIGVQPKYYFAAVRALKELLHRTLRAISSDPADYAATVDALDKLMLLDTQLVIDTYIRGMMSEIEAAHAEALRHARALEAKVAERTKELAELSRIDGMTGLLNQRTFFAELRRELARARREATSLAVVYFDLDDFKQINDARGHHGGDEILRAVGRTLRQVCREVDLASRQGGDEFAVALPDTDLEGARQFVARMTAAVTEATGVQISTGVSHTGPELFTSADELLHEADRRMLSRKRGRKEGTPAVRPKPGRRRRGADDVDRAQSAGGGQDA